MSRGRTVETLLEGLPSALSYDETLVALAKVVASLIVSHEEDLEKISLYSQFENLPEILLDALAYDFKVDWWDANYTLEEKIATLKDSFAVHKILGTKGAVEQAMGAIYPNTTVEEWFEYGGDPYTFRLNLLVDGKSVTASQLETLYKKLLIYKNARSHLEGIHIEVPLNAEASLGAYHQISNRLEILPRLISKVEVSGEDTYAGGKTQMVQRMEIFAKEERI